MFCDVTIACEGGSIKCHKIVLSASSAYFEKLFLENTCEHPIVFLKVQNTFKQLFRQIDRQIFRQTKIRIKICEGNK